MNFSPLQTLGFPLPQIRLPREQWPVVGHTIAAVSPIKRSLSFTFSSAARFWPVIRWSPELGTLRWERRKLVKRICRNRLYAEQTGKPTVSFPVRVRKLYEHET